MFYELRIFLWVVVFAIMACSQGTLNFESEDLDVRVQAGDEWIHEFPLFWKFHLNNPPQMAIWISDLDTNYLQTLFVTHKIAREAWISNGGNRRQEALPFWCHQRGVVYDDGLMLPTKEDPFVDGISGASPQEDFSLRLSEVPDRFLVFVEINHSTDFNDAFPKNAKVGDANYSGGSEGSGQPAVIYAQEVDLNSHDSLWHLSLIGHSSPDGSDGLIYTDISLLTTAKKIVKSIQVKKR